MEHNLRHSKKILLDGTTLFKDLNLHLNFRALVCFPFFPLNVSIPFFDDVP